MVKLFGNQNDHKQKEQICKVIFSPSTLSEIHSSFPNVNFGKTGLIKQFLHTWFLHKQTQKEERVRTVQNLLKQLKKNQTFKVFQTFTENPMIWPCTAIMFMCASDCLPLVGDLKLYAFSPLTPEGTAAVQTLKNRLQSRDRNLVEDREVGQQCLGTLAGVPAFINPHSRIFRTARRHGGLEPTMVKSFIGMKGERERGIGGNAGPKTNHLHTPSSRLATSTTAAKIKKQLITFALPS